MNKMLERLIFCAALTMAPPAYAQAPIPSISSPPPALVASGQPAKEMSSEEAVSLMFKLNGPWVANSKQCSTEKFGLLARGIYSEGGIAPKGKQESAADYQGRMDKAANLLKEKQIFICLPLSGPGVAFASSPSERVIYGRFNREFDVNVSRRSLGPRTIPTDTTPFKVELTEAFVGAVALDMPNVPPCLVEWNRRELDLKMPMPSKEEPWLEPFQWPRSEFEFKMPAGSGDELSLKSNGRFVIVGRLKSPWVTQSGRNLPATRADPIIRDDTVFTVHFEAEKFAILDDAGTEHWSCSVPSEPK